MVLKDLLSIKIMDLCSRTCIVRINLISREYGSKGAQRPVSNYCIISHFLMLFVWKISVIEKQFILAAIYEIHQDTFVLGPRLSFYTI
jgi:hypothetical protein